MNILYISYDGMTDPLGRSQVLPYLCGLSEKGYQIHLISAEKPGNFERDKKIIEQIVVKNKINWHPVRYTKKPPVLSTIIDIIRITQKAKHLHRQFRFDAVHCRSYISAFTGLKMKNKFGVRFIFDMRGFYADERVDGHIWNLRNPVYWMVYHYFKAKEKQFLSKADSIVSLTHAGKSIIEKWNSPSLVQSKITVIPCCADLSHFSNTAINQKHIETKQKELNLAKTDFVLSYLGSLGTWYMLDEMLLFFKILLTKKPESKFLVITKDDPKIMYQKSQQIGISPKSIRVIAASRDEVPVLLLLSNFSLFFIKPVFSKKASSPTKLAEILGLGIPVVCNTGVGDVDMVMSEVCPECLLHDFSESELQRVAGHIVLHPAVDGEKLRKIAEKYFSLVDGIEKYSHIYKKLTL